MITAHFFTGNKLLGTSNLPASIYLKVGQNDTPKNTAYFCPACGDIWGRIVVSDKQDYFLKNRFCTEHGSGLFQEYSSPMWHHYPKEVLYRELNLIAQHLAHNPDLDLNELILNWKRYYA
jgi:hypothetical protein